MSNHRRYRTTGPGGFELMAPSTGLAEHVTFALGQVAQGNRAWIKSKGGDVDDWAWTVEFRPTEDGTQAYIAPHAWLHEVSFSQPGIPGWIRQVRTIADRLTTIPGGTR